MIAEMVDDPRHHAAHDEHEISGLLVRWGHARDSDDWDALAACFHDDATIHISWISAPASEFITRSRELAAKRKPGSHTKHLIAVPWIRVNGDRAFSRCHVNLYIRADIGGHEFDVQSWFRFFDLLEKRGGAWRIVTRTAVYEKDRIDPVDPGGVPDQLLADMDFSGLPRAARHLCYLQQAAGRPTVTKVVSVYSDEEAALREAGEKWLAGG